MACLLYLIHACFVPNLKAQSCNEYFPSKTGTEWEMTFYDDNNKLVSTNHYKILSQSGNTYDVNLRIVDKKGKETLNTSTKWNCEAGKLSVEMRDIFPPAAAMNNAKAEMKMSGDNLIYPDKLVVGATLPDANSKMEMFIDGVRFMTMTMKVYDRKVEANENISTPLGNLDCVRMSQSSDVKSIINSKGKSVIWLAKNKGMVKSQNFNEKGKLTSTMVMTMFKE